MSNTESAKVPNPELDDEAQREAAEKLITKLAVMAVYDEDPSVIQSLEKYGIVGKDAILKRAEQHPEFDKRVVLAKRHEREADRYGSPSREVEIELKKLGITDGQVILGLSKVRAVE